MEKRRFPFAPDQAWRCSWLDRCRIDLGLDRKASMPLDPGSILTCLTREFSASLLQALGVFSRTPGHTPPTKIMAAATPPVFDEARPLSGSSRSQPFSAGQKISPCINPQTVQYCKEKKVQERFLPWQWFSASWKGTFSLVKHAGFLLAPIPKTYTLAIILWGAGGEVASCRRSTPHVKYQTTKPLLLHALPHFSIQSRHSQCYMACLGLIYHMDDQQPRIIDDERATLASCAGRAKPNVIISGQDVAFASQTGEIAAM